MAKKKITVVVNKAWEYEPFFNALTNTVLRAEGLPDPTDIVVPPIDRVMEEPRAKMSMENKLLRDFLQSTERKCGPR